LGKHFGTGRKKRRRTKCHRKYTVVKIGGDLLA
jgi:hypothetical protein